MKRRLLFKEIAALVFLTVLIGCEKEEIQAPKANNANIVGEWMLENLNYKGSSTVTVLGKEYKTNYIGQSVDSDFSVNYKENKEVRTSGSYKIKLTTTIMGQTTTTTESTEGILKPGLIGKWEIKGDSLYTIYDGDKTVSYIETLTKNKLKTVTIDKRTALTDGVKTTIDTKVTTAYIRK